MKHDIEPRPDTTKRRAFLRTVAATPFMVALGALPSSFAAKADGSTDRAVTVYRNPSCGCCGKWMEHLEENGFSVTVVDRPDVNPEKLRFGVPSELHACHTARIGGYTIEGHVPAADIERLLAERPPIAGLAVPGMPHGSPGMETGRVDRYAVIGFDADGGTRVFNRY